MSEGKDTLRFLIAQTEPITETGCWIWLGPENGGGYGRFGRGGKHFYTHRLMHELVKGPIPEGFQVDHICRVRQCINPEHLRAVTPRENVLYGESLPAKQMSRDTCRRGHPYVGAVRTDGSRHCRTCKNYFQNLAAQKKRAAKLDARAAQIEEGE